MMVKNMEPTLYDIEDYSGEESKEKRLTIWIVVISGLLIGAVYGIIASNSSISDSLLLKEQTGIMKY